MLVTQDGTRFCSGTMVNNSKQDGRQLYLTANHCMFMAETNFVTIFNYQKATCGDAGPEPSILQSAHGMRLLAKWAPSDFALLEIQEKIPDSYNVYFAGWDISNETPKNVFGIHHPSGDVKKFSAFNGTVELASWIEAPRSYHWKIPAWSRGTTEPGSSGSALFNDKGLVVGHLHGGQASCFNTAGYDVYGGIRFGWTSGGMRNRRLRDHLNPDNLHISALGGMSKPSQHKDASPVLMAFFPNGELEP